jgi:hypothetical protein
MVKPVTNLPDKINETRQAMFFSNKAAEIVGIDYICFHIHSQKVKKKQNRMPLFTPCVRSML